MKVMKFQMKNGHWIWGHYNPKTDEFILPSGYKMPVENGWVFYIGEWCELVEI